MNARKRIDIDKFGPKPKSFSDFLKFGDIIYLKKDDEFLLLDQIFKNFNPDVVINLAAQAGVSFSIKYPKEYNSPIPNKPLGVFLSPSFL